MPWVLIMNSDTG